MIKIHQPEEVPHLIIKFKLVNEEEQFEWGVTKGLPMMGLLGALTRAQITLNSESKSNTLYALECMLIKYTKKGFVVIYDPIIPVDPLIGMIEIIKATIVANINKSVEAHKNIHRVILGSK